MDKPFSQACENNKDPILNVLRQTFKDCKHVLEIGSGTGQHAVYFAQHLTHLTWQCSDAMSNHEGINAWVAAHNCPNLIKPIPFVVGQDTWPKGDFDGVFSANTAHIMHKFEVKLMLELIGNHLPKNGVFCQYGPFNQNGQYSSESNQAFDIQLNENGYGGIRDIEELQYWARNLILKEVITMPANNLTLVWSKK